MAQRVDIQYVRFYTSGSAAQRVAPAISVHTGALPQIKKRNLQRIYVDPVATLGIVVAVCMLVLMLVGVFQLRAEQRQTAAMVEYVELLRQENESLQAKYEVERDLESVKEIALALGMIPQEEAPHISIQVEPHQPEVPEQMNFWQRIGTFLAGLFA